MSAIHTGYYSVIAVLLQFFFRVQADGVEDLHYISEVFVCVMHTDTSFLISRKETHWLGYSTNWWVLPVRNRSLKRLRFSLLYTKTRSLLFCFESRRICPHRQRGERRKKEYRRHKMKPPSQGRGSTAGRIRLCADACADHLGI